MLVESDKQPDGAAECAGRSLARAQDLFFTPPSESELLLEQRLERRKVRDMRPSRRLGGATD